MWLTEICSDADWFAGMGCGFLSRWPAELVRVWTEICGYCQSEGFPGKEILAVISACILILIVIYAACKRWLRAQTINKIIAKCRFIGKRRHRHPRGRPWCSYDDIYLFGIQRSRNLTGRARRIRFHQTVYPTFNLRSLHDHHGRSTGRLSRATISDMDHLAGHGVSAATCRVLHATWKRFCTRLEQSSQRST